MSVAAAPARPGAIDRASLGALGLAIAAWAGAALSPAWLLLLSPLLLGAPHIVADVRHLVVHGPTRLRASTIVLISAPLAGMIAQRAAGAFGGGVEPHLEVGLGCAAIAVAALTARRTPAVAVAVLAVAVPALAAPRVATLVLLHAHNAVGFAIWLRWTRGGPARWPVAAMAIGGIALIALGACDRLIPEDGPLDLDALAAAIAPGLGPIAALRVVLIYAFAQALHYLAWLVLIPRARALPTSLRQDFGRAGVVAIALAVAGVPAAALAGGAAHARDVYLALVVFHAWLELAIVAHLIAGRDRLEDACCSPG